MRGPTVALVASLSLPLVAQHGSTSAVNPYTGPSHALAGAKLYRSQCAGCHGIDGAGTGAGPSLASGTFQRGGSDEALFQSISKGVPGTAMPGFAFSGLQVWQLVTHVRSLVIERGAAQSKGNYESGAALFRSNCSVCHTVRGEGGLSGPDLSSIGLKRSEAELRTAIADPDASVAPEYWSVVVKTARGETVRGTRLNEDTHSLQLREDGGRLLSLRKSDIAGSETSRKSPMPGFKGKLSDAQIDDVIAWLTRQREER